MTLFVVFRNRHQANVVDEFRTRATGCVSVIKGEIDQQMLVVEALRLFYAGSKEIERGEFHEFAAPMLRRYPRIQALEWIPLVPASQRESYELAARGDGLADYTITDGKAQGVMVASPRREVYFPVYFVEPHKGNEEVIGFDMGSNPARLEALRRSGETGEMAATSRISLIQDKSSRSGVRVFVPVYRKNSEGIAYTSGFGNIQGFVCGTFLVGDIVDYAMERSGAQSIDLHISDELGSTGRFLYCRSLLSDQSHADSELCDQDDIFQGVEYKNTINVGGRRWVVTCKPTRGFVSARVNHSPETVLGLGLLLSCLVAFYVMQIARHAGRMIAINHNLAGQIVQRKQAEEALKASNRDLVRTAKSLEAANSELTDFVYAASHDLREPLRKVSCFGDLLQESLGGKLEGDDQENLQFMIDGANRMSEMIDGLLTYSRMNTTDESSQMIDLNEIIEQLEMMELSTAIDESGTTISIPAALPCIHADELQLRQLMQNLIANAIKYRRPQEVPHIEIVAGEAEEEGWVRIEVRDNGIGIAEQYRDGVFKMFKRLHSRKEYEGTGIGLAICKKIADRHGGKIGVEANEPCGSTFWFTMPSADQPAAQAQLVGVA